MQINGTLHRNYRTYLTHLFGQGLNNFVLAGGNQRPLDPEERQATLSRLQTLVSMTWPGVRRAPLPQAQGFAGRSCA